MTRELWEGNQAIAEAAIRVGLEAYFGYPITPQNEILEWLSRRMPELGCLTRSHLTLRISKRAGTRTPSS